MGLTVLCIGLGIEERDNFSNDGTIGKKAVAKW